MATSSARVPGVSDLIAARRKWRWAAILLRVEALGALVVACLYLMMQRATVSPLPALFALLAAALMLPLSGSIERGRHGAGLVLAVVWSLRALQIALAPVETIVKQAPFLLLEAIVFGRALLAMAQVGEPLVADSVRKRSFRLTRAISPIIVAVVLIIFVPMRYAVKVMDGGVAEAARMNDRVGLLLLVLGAIMTILYFSSTEAVATGRRSLDLRALLQRVPHPHWPAWAWLDFAVGTITTSLSTFILVRFLDWIDQPEMMLPPVALFIPIACLLFMPLGLVWIGIGIGEVKGRTWTRTARIVAAIPILMAAVLLAPVVAAIIAAVVKELLH